MRSNTWMATALAMVACGGSSPSTADDTRWTVTGATPSGSTALPAPSSPDSCRGLMPDRVAAIEVVACSGLTATDAGPTGTVAAAATGDASGSLALGCRNAGTGRDVFFVFLPFDASYRRTSPLSERTVPLQRGYYATAEAQPAPGYFFDRSGRMLASNAAGGRAAASSAGTIEIVTSSADGVFARQYDMQGVPRGAAVLLGGAGQGSISLGSAANAAGHTLVIWGIAGEARPHARWLGPDGQPETAAFLVSGSPNQIGESAALPDGSIAVGGSNGPRWRAVIAQAATVESPVPGWLAARGSFASVRGGKALLFGQELVAADGTSCGSIALGSDPAGVSLDGTVATVASEKSFQVYPQLLK